MVPQRQRQRQRRTRAPLRGCDTFVAYPPTTPDGCAFFGKNSDRPKGEAQSLRRYSAGRHPPGSTLECTYLSIPQAAETFAVLVSQIDWMWGCEHGANEHGVCIGNEAVWTRVPFEAEPKTGRPASLLLGMDLVRLGLERSRSARSALRTITELLEEHGQGGACAEGDPSFCYHNSFLIADAGEAYVLETAGKHWVAQRWASGGRNLSNGLTIRNAYDLCSEGLEDYARELGLWDGTGPLDFAAVFGEDGPGGLPSEDEDDEDDDTRFGCGRALLEKHSGSGRFGKGDMVAILRDHSSGICMHGGGFETTASMVSELHAGNPGRNTHWTTGPHPCRSEFCRQEILEPPAAEANQGKRNE